MNDRRRLQRRDNDGPASRQQPPSAVTGEERDYLLDVIASGTPVAALLRDGRRISGRVLDFDNESIRFDLDGDEQVVSKSVIRYLEGD